MGQGKVKALLHLRRQGNFGEVQSMSINGNMHIDQATLDRKTLYTNPYLIVTEAEYTKHYYAESQRIASKLGGGWANALVDPLSDHLPDTLGFEHLLLNDLLIDRLENLAECVGLEARNAWYLDAFEAIADQHGVSTFEASQYFYHPDHLGSSSFITNAGGDVDQHLQYLPFGEPWIDQRTSNNIRFTFSGKERDEETGYNYFGARYYNSDVSIWLSVDPLSDKYPSLSPYTYCANSPIVLVDPDGKEPWIFDQQPDGSYKRREGTKNDGGEFFHTYNNNDGSTHYYSQRDNTFVTLTSVQKNEIQKSNEKVDRLSGEDPVTKFAINHEVALLSTAQNLQDIGDATAVAGFGVAVVGAAVAGVGAAPGLAIAGAGDFTSLLGSGLEILTYRLTGQLGEAGKEGAWVGGGIVLDAILDKAIPGPTPDLSHEMAKTLETGNELLKQGARLKLTGAERLSEIKE